MFALKNPVIETIIGFCACAIKVIVSYNTITIQYFTPLDAGAKRRVTTSLAAGFDEGRSGEWQSAPV